MTEEHATEEAQPDDEPTEGLASEPIDGDTLVR